MFQTHPDNSLITYSKITVLEHAAKRISEIDSVLHALKIKDEEKAAIRKAEREASDKKKAERERLRQEWDRNHWFGTNPYDQTYGELWDDAAAFSWKDYLLSPYIYATDQKRGIENIVRISENAEVIQLSQEQAQKLFTPFTYVP